MCVCVQSATKPVLSKGMVKKLKDIRLSLPDILSQVCNYPGGSGGCGMCGEGVAGEGGCDALCVQYQEAEVMTPAEVLIQQQLAYEAVSLSTRAPPTDPAAMPTDPASPQESKVTSAGKRSGKKVLSVREMVTLPPSLHVLVT